MLWMDVAVFRLTDIADELLSSFGFKNFSILEEWLRDGPHANGNRFEIKGK